MPVKTFGLLRVKNEARWIEQVIRSIQPVCSQIFVLDDHSTDATPQLCEAMGCTVIRSQFEGIDEARDKDLLLSRVWDCGAKGGDYCLMVDGDEALHPDDIPSLERAMQQGVVCGSMHIVYLWDSPQQMRVDRWYKEFRRPSLFRLTHRGASFKRTGCGGNFHCSNVPAELMHGAARLPVRLLHFGYMHKEDRVRKFYWYNAIDPNNVIEDRYQHMVVGDLFPADSRFRWAGPLELEPVSGVKK